MTAVDRTKHRDWVGALAIMVAAIGVAAPLLLRAQPPAEAGTGPQIFNDTCAACHGRGPAAGPSAPAITSASVLAKPDAALKAAIGQGAGVKAPNHAFGRQFTENQIHQIVVHMRLSGLLQQGRPAYVDPTDQVVRSQKQAFRLKVINRDLEMPWGLAVLPDGRMLVTERPGRLRFVTTDGKLSAPVTGTPKVWERQDSGLLDVAVHPDYAKNGWIYLSYVDAVPGYQAPPTAPGARTPSPPNMTVLIRGRINARNEWVDTQEIFRAPNALYTTNGSHYGSRFLFHGGYLYYSLGERGDPANAQKLDNPLGKIHRVFDDGRVPPDNPFVNTPGAVKTIWSYGHRNPEGLTIDPVSGQMWESEHGPTAGDEINVITRGGNYGWAEVSQGIQPGVTKTQQAGMIDPVAWYVPTLAPSGINFYAGDRYPGWKNSLFVAGLFGQQLRRLEVKDGKVVAQEVLYDQYGRNRHVVVGKDGYIYVLMTVATGPGTQLGLVSSVPGMIVRLEPVPASATASAAGALAAGRR